MTRHVADKRAASTGGRMTHFLRISRDRSESLWRSLWKMPRVKPAEGRRVVEFARIDRGREV